jgi:hypothetical protein
MKRKQTKSKKATKKATKRTTKSKAKKSRVIRATKRLRRRSRRRLVRAIKHVGDSDIPYLRGKLYVPCFKLWSKRWFADKEEMIIAGSKETGKSKQSVGFAWQVLKDPNHSSNRGSKLETDDKGRMRLIDYRIDRSKPVQKARKPRAAVKAKKQTVSKAPAAQKTPVVAKTQVPAVKPQAPVVPAQTPAPTAPAASETSTEPAKQTS